MVDFQQARQSKHLLPCVGAGQTWPAGVESLECTSDVVTPRESAREFGPALSTIKPESLTVRLAGNVA